jgi:protein-S-isoprenylcysteine O-methyltransferase Ste14
MEEFFYKSALLGLLVLFFIVRAPYVYQSRVRKTAVKRGTPLDRMLVLLATVGMVGLPLLYSSTPLLDPFSVPLPEALRLAGAAVYLAALVLMLLVQRELGGNWSMQLELKEDHRLVTSGPYRYVRHPMYTAFFLMMAGQLFLTANWLLGLYGIAAWTLLCFVRIPREEGMMLEEFGDEYRTYGEGTGRLVPRLGQG